MATRKGRRDERQDEQTRRLLEKAAELDRLRRFMDETTFQGDERESMDELSAVDQHPADTAPYAVQRDLDLTVRRILEIEAREVREALARQQSGQYGICEDCGRRIDPERLRARPEATRCIECQRARERSAR
ncbi:MAG TPA: TraR/DksA C4-type zinc finger protein [Chloroflexota bacterium]|jgi:RNA polymerase-binding transcription factor DksA